MNLMEAFKALDQLNEDVFSVDAEGIKKLNDFMQNDDSVDELSVFDIDSTEDDVIRDDEECNEGDMILDCCVCHSKVFKPVSEVVVDEESQIANAGEECPYCFSVEGYKIVGEVKTSDDAEYTSEEDVPVDSQDVSEVKVEESYSEEDVAAKGSTWDEFIKNLEDENEVKVDSAYRDKYTDEKIVFYKDGKSFEGEVTKYFNGDYELMKYNVHELPSTNSEDSEVEGDDDKFEYEDRRGFKYTEQELKDILENQRDIYPDVSYEDWIKLNIEDGQLCPIKEDISVEADSEIEADDETEKQESVKDRIIKCRMKGTKVNESIDLLTKDNTIASLLRDNMDKLSSITDVNELRDAIMDLVNESDIANKPSALKLKRDLYSKKSVGALLSTIGTYMTGEKVIKAGRASRKSRKESFKHRRKMKEDVDTDFQDAKEMWEMEDPDFDLDEYVEDFYSKAVKELSKKYKNLEVEPAIQSGTGSVFASYIRNDGKKMQAVWDYEDEVDILDGAFFDADSSKEFFAAVKSFIEEKLKDAAEMKESFKHRRKMKEDVDTIHITDDDIVISMSNDEHEDKEEDSVVDEEEVEDDLTVEPVSDEAKEQIEFNSIDRESAEDAIEDSLKESFGNVKFFRCSNIIPRSNRFIVEGVIGFNSGRKRNTNFVFKPRKITESKVIFKGYSKELRESVKSISLVCRNRGKKCIAESLKVTK